MALALSNLAYLSGRLAARLGPMGLGRAARAREVGQLCRSGLVVSERRAILSHTPVFVLVFYPRIHTHITHISVRILLPYMRKALAHAPQLTRG